MPKAIFTVLAAITAEDIAADAAAARAKHDKAISFYKDAVRRYRRDVPGVTDEEIAAMEQRGSCSRQGMYSLHADYREIAREASRLQLAQRTKPRAAEVAIAVINSYDIKDQLRTLGYQFVRDGYWHDFAGLRTSGAWTKRSTPDKAAADIDQLLQLGCDLELDGTLNTVAADVKARIATGQGPCTSTI
jgi:hypothetical protein